MNKDGGSPKDDIDPDTFSGVDSGYNAELGTLLPKEYVPDTCSGVGNGYNIELGKLLPKYLVPSTKENWEPVTLKQ